MVKLVDFGSAHFICKTDEVSNVAGTYAFMAPEMVSGKHNIWKAKGLDVWAAGVTLFYCLANKIPWKGRKFNEVTESIINETVVLPEKLSPEC